MSKRKPKATISDDDIALFRDSLGDGVRPIKQAQVEPPPKRPPPIPRKKHEDEALVLRDMMSDDWQPDDIPEAGEGTWYARPGLQQNVQRKLRRGQFSIAAELDLHGMTVPEARAELLQFLAFAAQQRSRCVRIIHGKGRRSRHKPVLKEKVDIWLRQIDEVLAYCSARPHDGGTGALYVLLKQRH